MKSTMRIISIFLVITIILSGQLLSAENESAYQPDNINRNIINNSFEDYLSEYYGNEYPNDSIEVTAENAVLSGTVLTENKLDGKNVKTVLFDGSGSCASFSFEVKQTGLYRIKLLYIPIENKNNFSPIEINLVNDGISYDWLKGIGLDRIYTDAEKITTDSEGNEMTPRQKEVYEFNSAEIKDIYSKPISLFFSEGRHNIEICGVSGNFCLYSLKVFNPSEVYSYTETENSENNTDFIRKIEAEAYYRKSSISIVPENDPADIDTSPNDPVKQRLNYISGTKYKEAGNWIEYKFTVPNDGYYSFDMRVRQNYNSGMSSVRSFSLDGEYPFSECEEILFPYSGGWYLQKIGSKEAYRFYLKKGEHILRLTAVYGSLSKIVNKGEEIVSDINALYSSVIMRIGTNPDKYRDYDLKSEIKDIDIKISEIYSNINSLGIMITETNGGKTGSAMSSVQTLENMFLQLKKNPDALALKMETLKNNTESLAAFINNLREQPLDLDYIRVYSSSNVPKTEKSTFIEKVLFDLKRLAVTFGDDYKVENSDKKQLKVWVNAGRDQMKVLKRQIENGFTRDMNTYVELAINTDITGAVLAGVGPDVCLFMSADTPINLAVRGVLEDLSQYEDFNQIAKRFDSNALVPYQSIGGCYALPLSVSWPMMFVRNDIFESLKIEIPRTWNDMYKAAAVLQRNYLEIGIPSHVGMFFTLLYQNDGSVFNNDLKTTFGDAPSLAAFSTWTSFFSEYSFPLSFDFFNRFRSGEMPIGIADYTMYAQIKAAAPEIRDRWSMYAIPGTENSNGKINSSVSTSTATGVAATSGLAQGATVGVIFSASKEKSLSWDFLRWFTSAETQAEYGLGIEAELGYYGRYATANLEAIGKLPWTSDELKVLSSSRKNIVMIDEYPGSYFIAREVNNAFRSVVNNGVNPADILSRKNVLINKELQRKYKQFDISSEVKKK